MRSGILRFFGTLFASLINITSTVIIALQLHCLHNPLMVFILINYLAISRLTYANEKDPRYRQ